MKRAISITNVYGAKFNTLDFDGAWLDAVGLREAGGRLVFLDKAGVPELRAWMKRRRGGGFVIIDSIQFAQLTFAQYKSLKEDFPGWLFVYVSHVDGSQPDGQVAKRIWRDANVYFRVEGQRAFPVSRYGGGRAVDVWPEFAAKYWVVKNGLK